MKEKTHFVSLVLDEKYRKKHFKNKIGKSYQSEVLNRYQNKLKQKNFEYQMISNSYFPKKRKVLEQKLRELMVLNSELDYFESDLLYLLLNGTLDDYRNLGYSKDYILHLVHRKADEVRNYDEKIKAQNCPIVKYLKKNRWK